MKVLMFGDSQVGKTTLMVSAYGMMSENNIQGFRVRCRDNNAHRKLINAYQAFRLRGQYPLATERMETYEYDFFSDAERVLSFTLTDIRGESVLYADTSKLGGQIREADAVMLFFNGYRMSEDSYAEDSLLDLMPLLNANFETDTKERMLMAVFTHMDRFDNPMEAGQRYILPFCYEFIQMSKRNERMTFQIAPTGCAPARMMNLDFMMIALMLFGHRCEVARNYQTLTDELASIQQQFGDGFWNDVKEFFGLNKARKRARERYRELSPKIDYYNSVMLPKFEAMRRFYMDYPLFSPYPVSRDTNVFSL